LPIYNTRFQHAGTHCRQPLSLTRELPSLHHTSQVDKRCAAAGCNDDVVAHAATKAVLCFPMRPAPSISQEQPSTTRGERRHKESKGEQMHSHEVRPSDRTVSQKLPSLTSTSRRFATPSTIPEIVALAVLVNPKRVPVSSVNDDTAE
jgi:hypothetical protein